MTEDGEPEGFLKILRDRTQQERAEAGSTNETPLGELISKALAAGEEQGRELRISIEGPPVAFAIGGNRFRFPLRHRRGGIQPFKPDLPGERIGTAGERDLRVWGK